METGAQRNRERGVLVEQNQVEFSVGSRINIFVDECGTAELDLSKPNVSRFFILVAVLLDDEQMIEAKRSLDLVADRLCGGAEIKSSRIGNDGRRRIRFLEAIQDIDFRYVALIVDKSRLWADSGLGYKRTFHKFMTRLIHGRFQRFAGGVNVVMDQHGSQDFMEGFSAYLEKLSPPNLFFESTHCFESSAQSRPIQLADLIAGSLYHWIDPSRRNDQSPRLRELLRGKEADVVAWPLVDSRAAPDSGTEHPEIDEVIWAAGVDRANRLIQLYRTSANPSEQLRGAVLERLLFARLYEVGSERSIFTDVLMRLLEEEGHELPAKQAFRSSVIGGLRDDGVLIAGTSEGYRLALTTGDVDDYLGHTESVVIPMLARVAVARGIVEQDTGGNHDVLEPKHPELKAVVDSYGDSRLTSFVGDVSVSQSETESEAEPEEA